MCVEASDALGSAKGAETRVWSYRFRSARELLVPVVALPTRGNFWSLMARRVRSLKLSAHQTKEVLVRGAEFRAALKCYRGSDPGRVVQTRGRDVAAGSSARKCVRRY